jgi:hypothetical protein
MTKLIFAFHNFAKAHEDFTFFLRIFKDNERVGAREMHTKFWYGNPMGRQFGRPRLRWRITLNLILNQKVWSWWTELFF